MGREKMGREKMGRLMLMTVTIILLATVAVQPASARRQKSEESWDNLEKLRVGEEIQVVYQEEQYLNGRFLGFTPDGITVQWGRVNPHEETVPRKDVIRVIASRPSARVKNVLAGLGGGALVGLGIAGSVGHSESGPEILAIPAGGAVIGAIAGALSSPDATIYQSPREQARRVAVQPELKRRRPVATGSEELDPAWNNLRELHMFQEIRIVDQDGKVYDGRFYSVSDEAISFDGSDGEVLIQRHEVVEVSMERPSDENSSGWTDVTDEERVTIYSSYARPEAHRTTPPCRGRIAWNRVLMPGSSFQPSAQGPCSERPWESMISH